MDTCGGRVRRDRAIYNRRRSFVGGSSGTRQALHDNRSHGSSDEQGSRKASGVVFEESEGRDDDGKDPRGSRRGKRGEKDAKAREN